MDIVTSSSRIIQYNGLLVIQNSHISDSGLYVCAVNNSVGEERIDITLLVTGN